MLPKRDFIAFVRMYLLLDGKLHESKDYLFNIVADIW